MPGVELVDNPLITSLEEDLLGGFGGFPGEVLLISVGDDLWAANNATLPDGGSVNGLACFKTPDDASSYAGSLGGLDGEFIKKKFDDARDIAIRKERLQALFLFVDDAKIAEIHFVK